MIFLNFFKKINYSISIYGIEIIPKISRLKRLSIKNAHKIITISLYTENLILDQFPHIKNKIFQLKSCVDDELFNKVSRNKTLTKKYKLSNKKVIMTLSRLSSYEEKGHDRVLKSLSYLYKIYPNFIYMIVGGGEDVRVKKF